MRLGLVWFGAALAAAISIGCAGPRPEVRTALTGTLPELQQEIARAEKSGSPSRPQRPGLAHAVAEREIAGATGPDGARQLAVFRPCLPQLETAIDERAARGDEAAAVATLLLFEAGKRPANELVTRYQEADSAAFRAL